MDTYIYMAMCNIYCMTIKNGRLTIHIKIMLIQLQIPKSVKCIL